MKVRVMTQKAPAIPSAAAFVVPMAHRAARTGGGGPVQQEQAGALDRLAVGLDRLTMNATAG